MFLAYTMPTYRLLTRSILILFAVISALATTDEVTAEAVVEIQEGWVTLGDSLPISGTYARPRICPVDSAYVAYEIRGDSLSSQYIFHRPTGIEYLVTPLRRPDPGGIPETIPDRVSPESGDTSSALLGSAPSDSRDTAGILLDSIPSDSNDAPETVSDRVFSCGNLSWCPVAVDDRLWAAYVAGSGRIVGVYLYESKTRTSYPVWITEDTLTDNPATAWGVPQWSPDGTCLAFTIVENGESDIFVIRNLKPLLEDPLEIARGIHTQVLIGGEGNQFQPIWCPVKGSGLAAYTLQRDDDKKLRIEVFDALGERSFELPVVDSTRDYFGPSWNSGGRKLAFYRHEDIRRVFDSGIINSVESCELGIAAVSFAGDSLSITEETPPDTFSKRSFRVIPNADPFSGPEWLPGGRHLLISSPDDFQQVRFRVVSIPDFTARDGEIDYILRGGGGGQFPFPRDVDVRSRQIAFVYGPSSHSSLVMGELIPNLILVSAVENLRVDYERRLSWEDFAHRRKRGGSVFGSLWDFLWSPIAGPDIGINKRIVPVAGGIIALAVILSGDEGGGITPISPRDWTPPEFPNPGPKKSGVRMEFGL